MNLPVDKDIGKKRPIDYFQLYIIKDIIDQWVQNTNSSGKALAKGRTWRYITFSEILALVMFSGVFRYPERGIAWDWDPKYGIEWVKSTMDKGRFDFILTRWSYEDSTMMSKADRAVNN